MLIAFRAYIWRVYLVIKVLKSLGALRMILELLSLPLWLPQTPMIWQILQFYDYAYSDCLLGIPSSY